LGPNVEVHSNSGLALLKENIKTISLKDEFFEEGPFNEAALQQVARLGFLPGEMASKSPLSTAVNLNLQSAVDVIEQNRVLPSNTIDAAALSQGFVYLQKALSILKANASYYELMKEAKAKLAENERERLEKANMSYYEKMGELTAKLAKNERERLEKIEIDLKNTMEDTFPEPTIVGN